jgi:dsDNA-specific endonuclease/ATPase MutS2
VEKGPAGLSAGPFFCEAMPNEPSDSDDPIRIPVTEIIDLHTVAPRDVKPVVEEYLSEAHRLGLRALRIIHGRGIGAQRETVRRVLAQTPFVESFADAPAEAGGWGATVVTLRDK